MDFSLSDCIQKLLQQVREFLNNEVYPLEKEFFNKKSFSKISSQLEEKRNLVKKQGWWAPHIPKEHGGMGLKLTDFALLSEELGRSPLGHYIFNCQAPDVGNMEILLKYGSKEQQDKYLWPLINGEIRSCFSMTEPDFPGSNPAWMGTTAVEEDSDYVINGHKWFTTAAEGAYFAIVMAITSPDAQKYRRASQIIVPVTTSGFHLVRNIPIMGEEGDGYLSHAEIHYQNCRIPITNRLGGEGDGFVIAQERLGPGRIHHCMRWIGICERAFDLMCKRAVSREIAPGVKLGEKQLVQQWIAESRATIDAARLMVMRTAWKMEKMENNQVRTDISLIKFFVANAMIQVIDRSIQTHGALGITDDTPLAWFYRFERPARIYDGPDEVHKIAAAKHILKKYQS